MLTIGDIVTTSIANVAVINSDVTDSRTYILPASIDKLLRFSHAESGKLGSSLLHKIAKIPQMYLSSRPLNPFSDAASETLDLISKFSRPNSKVIVIWSQFNLGKSLHTSPVARPRGSVRSSRLFVSIIDHQLTFEANTTKLSESIPRTNFGLFEMSNEYVHRARSPNAFTGALLFSKVSSIDFFLNLLDGQISREEYFHRSIG